MKNLINPRRLALAGAAIGFLAAGPAYADYMSECDELIQAWNDCRAAATTRCTAEEQRIIDECRCHERQGDEWLFVRGSLSSGVCNAGDPPTIITPPPPPPPPRDITTGEPRPGGEDEEHRGGDEDGDGDDSTGRGDGEASAPATPSTRRD